MLEITDLHKRYGSVEALRGVDLTIGRGEIVGLVGPNGAGKTSLVSIVADLRRPDRGTVTVDGLDVATHRDEVGSRLGLAPQELAIYPTLKVRDNLVLYAELAGLRRQALRTRVAETAEALGLTELLDRPAQAMSGGQKRRLHTAMALVHRPPLLLLDEPTVGADVDSRQQLLALVHSLADDGAAICYSTHYLPEVESLGATIVVLEAGRVVARGPLDSLVATYARAAVELTFDGPPPDLGMPGASVEGTRMRIVADNPGSAAATLLARLGELNGRATSHLVSVEVIHPTLEAVYLAVTGRRYDMEEALDAAA
jgi:ABC-2 type transport system ATP-binding protein